MSTTALAHVRRHRSLLVASLIVVGAGLPHLPVALAWVQEVRSWSLALREERRIKRMRKAEKEALLQETPLQEVETPCPPPSS